MPLTISAPLSPHASFASLRERRHRRGSVRDRGRFIRVGLVNNMPDAAVSATQQQFARLIEDASGDFEIELNLYSLETLPREASAGRAIAATYRAARELRGSALDAVIITGAEPRAPDPRDEPYWRELAGLIDWARTRALSTVFSCLAGHAAVLHRDGIARRRLPAKLSGVFQAEVANDHELLEGFGDFIATPHSRLNGLDETELARAGYSTLTRSREAGVDIFVRQEARLQVFLQGHPEYDSDTLAREFRRDALRFARGEAAAAPSPPRHYFPPALAALVDNWMAHAARDPNMAFPTEALAFGAAHWRANAVRLFRNWLAIVARLKSERLAPTFARARARG